MQRGKNRPGAGKVFESFCKKHIGFFKLYSYVEGKNIGVWFDEERINTLEENGEILITVLSAMVQWESRNISENIK